MRCSSDTGLTGLRDDARDANGARGTVGNASPVDFMWKCAKARPNTLGLSVGVGERVFAARTTSRGTVGNASPVDFMGKCAKARPNTLGLSVGVGERVFAARTTSREVLGRPCLVAEHVDISRPSPQTRDRIRDARVRVRVGAGVINTGVEHPPI